MLRHGRLLLPVPAFLLAGFASGPSPQDAAPFRISVDVNLVMLQATVRDRNGLVSDLHEPDFRVFEDGVPQTIHLFRHEDVPITVGLVVDHSGSMRPKLKEVVAATHTFVRSSNPEDQMFVVNFNDKVTLGLRGPQSFSNSSEELESAISRTRAEGMTTLYDAVIRGLEQLQAGDREKKVLIVISDGGDNASKQNLAAVLKAAELSSALIYTVGIFDADDEDRNPAVLRRLAQSTGGEAYFPAELDEVVPICERIARDIRNQYAIGYLPRDAAAPGVYRRIRVEAAAEGHHKLSVHARTGYIGSLSENPRP
jgi:VWFA-related protein